MEMTGRQQWAAFRTNLRSAPRSVVALGALSLLATLAYLPTIVVPTDIREQLLPYTGWWASSLLLFSVIGAASLITFRQRRAARALVFFGWVTTLSAVYHAYELGRGSTNPYHSASPWLVAWELALATALFAVGTSPRVQAYCRGAP